MKICEHVKDDGTQCATFAIKGSNYCRHHDHLHKPAPEKNEQQQEQTAEVGTDLKLEAPADKEIPGPQETANADISKPETYICGNCEQKITRDDSFCPSCGQKLEWDQLGGE